ncbi:MULTISPECIES: LPD29 domain-containing protein [Photorhabdus]|uniref:Large polyvalent protein associated domain-containing protein n=2 Tax=Photorhabdus TaxID=29487 RepID=A0A7X5TN77_9GAMM|nr:MULTISPECIES: LPD29 domain-containing protein [Photorhabdus]MQL50088.1 hypothetical protein [Photorhabdus khanii]NHB98374.1 hypothetical protein [Photorhabdus stackebrandtii]
MTTLSVGQYINHDGAEYVISAVDSIEGKISYTILGLDNPTLAEVQETSLRFYKQSDKIMPLADVHARLAVVQAVIQRREQEKLRAEQEHRELTAKVKSMPEYSDLLTVDKVQDATNCAAKNIRILLKKHFKGVTFSVRKRHYTCINVSWTDGPTKDAVEDVIGRFQEGEFNGMQEMYEYNCTPFHRVYGGVKYLFCGRDFSDELIAEAIEILRKKYGENTIKPEYTVVAYRKGGLWSECREQFHHGLQSKIDSLLSDINKIKS